VNIRVIRGRKNFATNLTNEH